MKHIDNELDEKTAKVEIMTGRKNKKKKEKERQKERKKETKKEREEERKKERKKERNPIFLRDIEIDH